MGVQKELFKAVTDFMKEQNITCPETIFQCDWVSENSLKFIAKLCDIVGYPNDEENEDAR